MGVGLAAGPRQDLSLWSGFAGGRVGFWPLPSVEKKPHCPVRPDSPMSTSVSVRPQAGGPRLEPLQPAVPLEGGSDPRPQPRRGAPPPVGVATAAPRPQRALQSPAP